MRTKHLLYTMALASVFAACTQDEFVTESGINNPLEGRKSLGKITLVEPEAASTRWVVNDWDEIVPELGDGFSYLLVDVPREDLAVQHEYPIDNYRLVNNIQTNYVFKKTAQGFENDANLVEGNYLLVGPSQNVQGRKPVEITLPAEQNLAFGADGEVDPLSIIKEFNKSGYPIYIGHRFLSEGSDYNNELPKRHHIFAYPEITVTNNDVKGETAKPTVVKVILKSEDEKKPFIINAPLNNEKAARLLTNESFKAVEGDEQFPIVVGAWEGYRTETLGVNEKDLMVDQTNTKNTLVNQDAIPADAKYIVKDAWNRTAWKTFMYNNGLGGSTSDLLDNSANKTSVSKYIVINMPEGGVTLEAGESFKFNAIIPAESYEMGESLILYAVLENGDIWKKVMKSNAEEMTINPGKRYPQEDYNGTKLEGEVGEYFTIGVHDGYDGVSNYVQVKDEELEGFEDADAVMTTEELVKALKSYSSTRTMNVTIGGKDVVYDQRAEAALANNNAQVVNILGHIKIDGGKDGLTINPKVSFADAAIDNGTVVFNSDAATLGTVLVGKDATFELRGAKGETAEIHNVGTLRLYATAFNNVHNYNIVEVYDNMGTKQIKNGKNACGDGEEIISKPINLKSSMILKAVKEGNEVLKGVYTQNEDVDFPITIESYDKDNVAKLTLGANVKIVKNGSIKNNGTITSSASQTTLTVTRGLGETLTNGVNGNIESKVIIEGASHLLSALGEGASIPADYKTAAQVTNNGILKDVTVDGKLIMGAGSRITGTIDNADTATEGEIDNTGRGYIEGNVPTIVKVVAEYKSLNMDKNADMVELKADMKAYANNYKVTVIRLTGAVTMDDTNRQLMESEVGNVTLEFAQNSSLTIGYAKLKSDLDITVTGKDIQWNGAQEGRSTFEMSGQPSKGLYIDNETGKVAEGNVVFNNCDKVTGLE